MIVDSKSHDPLTSERKLSIDFPNSRQIYTTGSFVTGIIRLGAKELQRTSQIKVSVVCTVRSVHHKYYGGTSHDIRRETTKLIHEDEVLWSSPDEGISVPPADIPFNIIIPDVGFDKKAKNPNAALPPSFHAGSRHGWKYWGTHGSPIGSVKYYVKVVVARKGAFSLTNKAVRPFIFLPPSPPPPLLPLLPETDLGDPINLPETLWNQNTTTSIIRHVFTKNGQARLSLWIPCVPAFARMTRVPFVLCFVTRTQSGSVAVGGLPSQDHLPPAAQVGKATLYLQRIIKACARGGKETHVRTLKKASTDNLLYGLVPEEGEWTPKTIFESGTEKYCWEKRCVWRGMWTCKETPSFVNRQLTWEYVLVGEVPITGLGNGVKVVSQPVEISSGMIAGTNPSSNSEEDELDLPPDYFELDANEDDDDGGDEKSHDHKV